MLPGPMKRSTTCPPSAPVWEILTPPSMTAWARTHSSPWLKILVPRGSLRRRAVAATILRTGIGNPTNKSAVARFCGDMCSSAVTA